MKLNIVIHLTDQSFNIVNGYPLVYRLLKNIESNILEGSVNIVYRPVIYLEGAKEIFEKHKAYINTLKNVLTGPQENCDYVLHLKSNTIYLDDSWLFNLLNFANKHRAHQVKMVTTVSDGQEFNHLNDYLKSYDIGRESIYKYCINDILNDSINTRSI